MPETRTETLHFSVSGEFITDLARTWFWDEERPVTACRELLASCLDGTPGLDFEQTVTDILEGRKKLTGINEFTLVPDPAAPKRSLLSRIERGQRRALSYELEQDMQSRFIRYVDPYATVKSLHPSALALNGSPTSWEECKEYFLPEDYKAYLKGEPFDSSVFLDMHTAYGLWLRDQKNLVLDACRGDLSKVGRPAFWSYIYEQTKDDETYDQRNACYLTRERMKHRRETELNLLFYPKPGKEQPPENTHPYLSRAYLDQEYRAHPGERIYDMDPDDFDLPEGIASPNGDWYSCGFGCHNGKAYYLICCYPERFGYNADDIRRLKERGTLRADNALDLLVEHGWAAVHNLPLTGSVVTWPERRTKALRDCVMTAAERHHLDISYKNVYEL